MGKTTLLRMRMDARIERRRAIPFPLSLEDHRDILPPLAQTAAIWDELDDEDFSHLKSKA